MVRRVRSRFNSLLLVFVSSACASLSGQQPNNKLAAYVAPLLPAEQAWTITLASPPSAGAVMDGNRVYVPVCSSVPGESACLKNGDALSGDSLATRPLLVALDRETGATRWSYPVETALPPVLSSDFVIVASGSEIHAFSAAGGEWRWGIELPHRVRGPLVVQDRLLVGVTDGDEIIAVSVDTREIVWQRQIRTPAPAFVTTTDQVAYMSTSDGRAMCISLADGSIRWERQLQGALTPTTIDDDLLFVGSDANLGSLWALDANNGSEKWSWKGHVFGGDVVGTAVSGDTVYVVSQDNILRGLNRRNGNQRWKTAVGTRPVLPPQAFDGIVAVTGLNPTLSTFSARTGMAVSMWTAPSGVELQGPPLIDKALPFRVAIVVLLKEGQVIALRSVEMLFKQPDAAPLTTLPGRTVPREPAPNQSGTPGNAPASSAP